MLKLENICVTINGKKILDNISCEIKHGDLIVIVGPNGAGKSTLFDIIAGKRRPDSGKIFLAGQDITHLSEQQRAPVISRLFQEPSNNSVSTMTVAQNLAMSQYKGKRTRLVDGMKRFPKRLIDSLAQSINLTSASLLTTKMGSLSGGQRQLIAFIMSCLIPPRILLLDEPTAALDPSSATKLLLFALQYIKEHTITTLLITHDPQLALIIGNKLWVLEDGQLKNQFDQNQKKNIPPKNLMDHIDYQQIAGKE